MKKLSLAIVIALLAACASSPATWKNMSEREISQWKDIGFNATQAQAWRGGGFTAEQSERWSKAGFTLESASHWHANSFNVQEAKNWHVGGFNVKDAVKARSKGLTPVKPQ